jgi:hypothetical protein
MVRLSARAYTHEMVYYESIRDYSCNFYIIIINNSEWFPLTHGAGLHQYLTIFFTHLYFFFTFI